MRPSDPRIRQTLNQISQNIESANLSTQANLFSFSQNYVNPCLSSFNACLEASCQPCFAAIKRDDRRPHHRQRQRPRGRENLAFDFYDDWEQDEAEWGNDELDRLLSADGDPRAQQPGMQGVMSYGTRGTARRKGEEEDDDVNILPKSSMFGFLERLPWKIGGRGVRYRPSVADLQVNVGKRNAEAEPLMPDGEGSGGRGRHGRTRSDTVNSRSTTNSLSSRGDLFPSEDEDDAVPLDDEFAMVLERRTTGAKSDDRSSGKKSKKRPPDSRTSWSSKSTRNERGGNIATDDRKSHVLVDEEQGVPLMADLKQEEEGARPEEEAELAEKRQAAQRLAFERGLNRPGDTPDVSYLLDKLTQSPMANVKQDPVTEHNSKESSTIQETEILSPTQSHSQVAGRDPSPSRTPEP